jgi:hypothetical protein
MNRRTVLRQSVKLAYATPLIAASMSLESGSAQEAMSFPCTPERIAACGPCATCYPDLECIPIEGCVPD